MYIGSTLRDNQHNTLPPFKKGTIPTSHIDDGNESDDPFGPPDTDPSPNSFLESLQQNYTGDIEVVAKKLSETSTTPLDWFVYLLSGLDLTLTRVGFWRSRFNRACHQRSLPGIITTC